jgi:hypothetical protein
MQIKMGGGRSRVEHKIKHIGPGWACISPARPSLVRLERCIRASRADSRQNRPSESIRVDTFSSQSIKVTIFPKETVCVLCVFGFRSNLSTFLVRDNPGQPGVALCQLRPYGSLDEGPRHLLSTDAAAEEISESSDMGRALTKRVDYHGSNYFRLGNADFRAR